MRLGRILSLVVALLSTICISAESISQSEAYRKAQEFMKSKGVAMPGVMKLAGRAPKRNAPKSESDYYVFNADGKGFVVVSGDDRTVPILGYSLTGTFNEDSIPDNMRAWLQNYSDEIQVLDGMNLSGNAVQDSHAPQKRMSNEKIGPLLKSEWNQGYPYSGYEYLGEPYNMFCPVDLLYDLKSKTGCVATAMAQVMYYHKWPDATISAIPGYKNYDDEGYLRTIVDGFQSGISFDWDNMLDIYNPNDYNRVEAEAVARLMAVVGASVKMDYTCISSGAVAHYIVPALRDVFNYDEGMYLAYREKYTIASWNSLLLNELMNNRPVVYCGSNENSGHCFVIDGYDGNSMFHVNWGWGGTSDGYFAISVLNPYNTTSAGASSFPSGYSMGQSAVIGMQKPQAGSIRPVNDLLSTKIKECFGSEIVIEAFNNTESAGVFYFGLEATNINTGRTSTVGQIYKTVELDLGWGYPDFEFNVSGLQSGTYKIYPVSGKDLNNLRPDNDTSYFYVHAQAKAYGDIILKKHPVSDLAFTGVELLEGVNTPNDLALEKYNKINAIIDNNGYEYNGELYLFYKPKSSSKYYYTVGTVAIPEGETSSIEFFIYVENAENYDIVVSTAQNLSDENVIGRQTLFSEDISLTLEAFEPKTAKQNEACDVLFTIKNNSAFLYSGPMYILVEHPQIAPAIYSGDNFIFYAGQSTTIGISSFVPSCVGTYTFTVSTDKYFTNIIGRGEMKVEAAAEEQSVLSILDSSFPEEAVVDETFAFSIVVGNTGADYNGPLYLFAYPHSHATDTYTRWNFQQCQITAGSKLKLDCSFIPSVPGDYKFVLSTDENRNNIVGEINYSKIDGIVDLTVTGFNFSQLKTGVDINVNVTVKNNTYAFDGKLSLWVYKVNDNTFPPYSESRQVAIGDFAEKVVPFMFRTDQIGLYNLFVMTEDKKIIGLQRVEIVQGAYKPEYDLNGDGTSDDEDISSIYSFMLGNTEAGFKIDKADMNKDGRINAVDVSMYIEIVFKTK